ncbi:MAG: hypothetical protein ACP5SD_05325 [Elusimicrobiales bacterium]
MKYSIVFLFMALFVSVSFSQTKTGSKAQAQKDSKQNVTISTQTQSSNIADYKNPKSELEKTQKKEQTEDYSQSEVLVDKMNFDTESTGYSYGEENQDIIDPDALPYSYGVIKGVINLEGKNILVLESDDGTINFIYVYNDRGKMKWKIYGKIKRNY